MHKRLTLLILFTLAVCVLQLPAATITFNLTMTGDQEVPPVATPASGPAKVVIDDVANTVFVDLSYSGLLTPAINAHIHCCNGPGVNSPVVIPFLPAGFMTGSTSGAFTHTFTGVAPSLIASLIAGQGYINIHTPAPLGFPGGEIRADIVPEPATLLFVGLGLAGLGLWRRRRN
jgi:hypothetical protein